MDHVVEHPREFFSNSPLARSPMGSGEMDLLDAKLPACSPRYERKDDGEIEYTMSFDLKDYSPDDVRIRMGDRDRIVTVDAQTASQDGSQQKEFHHKFTIPPTVDAKRLRSVYRKDGTLVLRAPMLPPAYRDAAGAPKFPQLNLHHHSPQLSRSSKVPRSPLGSRSPIADFRDIPMAHSPRLTPEAGMYPRSPLLSRSPHLAEGFRSHSPQLSRNSPVFFSDFHVPIRRSNTPVPGGDRYIEEMIIDPEFQATDLKIAVRDNTISVSAKRQEPTQTREYKNEHQLPANVDGSKLSAKLADGLLILEAPFKLFSSPTDDRKKFTDLPVEHD